MCVQKWTTRRKSGKLDTMRSILEKNSRPPSPPTDRDETTEIMSIELIHTLPVSHKIEQKTFFLQMQVL